MNCTPKTLLSKFVYEMVLFRNFRKGQGLRGKKKGPLFKSDPLYQTNLFCEKN